MFDFYYFIYRVSSDFGCTPFRVLFNIDDYIIKTFSYRDILIDDKYSLILDWGEMSIFIPSEVLFG